MTYKKFGTLFIIIFVILLVGLISFTGIVDPYFHYHKPLKSLKYKLNNERYQNDGIVKNFDYDSIITGTSMTENFKTSEFDKLFKANSVKVSLSGSTYKETNDLLVNAFESNKNIKYVVRGLDYYFFYTDKDAYRYEYNSYPNYLYNDDIFDDVKYLLNKEVILYSLTTLNNKTATTFDDYSAWGKKNYGYGKKALDSRYQRPDKSPNVDISESDIKILKDSINQNVISLIKQYPDTQFYIFYPPYSIYYWDYYNQQGILNKMLYGEKIITEMLLEYDNVHIFSFLDAYDITTNLDNYKDKQHYSPKINSFILKSMNLGEHKLTKSNYNVYYDKIIKYYNNYDYDALFE